MAKKAGWIIACWVLILGGLCGWAEGQTSQSRSSGIEKGAVGTPPAPVVVMVYNRPIITLRVPLLGSSPQERARASEERISALIEKGRLDGGQVLQCYAMGVRSCNVTFLRLGCGGFQLV